MSGRVDHGIELHQCLGQNPHFMGRSGLLAWARLVRLSFRELSCRMERGDGRRREIQGLSSTGNSSGVGGDQAGGAGRDSLVESGAQN